MAQVAAHYSGLFGSDDKLDKLREQYAMQKGSVPDASDLQALTGVLLLVSMGCHHRQTGCGRRELHQQLAARATNWQYTNCSNRYLVYCQ
jgi:hypothetical protein